MIAAQRRRHLLIWMVLGPLMVLGLVVALLERPPAALSSETGDAKQVTPHGEQP